MKYRESHPFVSPYDGSDSEPNLFRIDPKKEKPFIPVTHPSNLEHKEWVRQNELIEFEFKKA